MRGLATFASTSGLVANGGKSNVYFCNVDQDEREGIKNISGFQEAWGRLRTKDKLKLYGVVDDDSCPLCGTCS
uniref:Uncharacterized protein n=1 Tax=Chenopodium quinoa TaxID=63459 RepID=A0A803MB25_CHEQI